jgi:long-chain fatty acid transport protein
MRRRASQIAKTLAVVGLGLWVATPMLGAGFGIFEQGSKAMGMAGAFTAQADDPSAMWHNAAGLGFQKERDFAVGFTWIRSLKADFHGANPFPGAGIDDEQKTLSELPPHAYWVEPLGSKWTFGLGVNSPFGLVTEWDPNNFSGRFISSRAELITFDVNPNLAVQLSDDFSLGFGIIGRFSKVKLRQNIPFPNPFTQTVSDVGQINLDSDLDNGVGFNLGFLHKTNEYFSWGLSYRSEVGVDFGGSGRVRQIPTGIAQLDGIVAATLPFDRDLPVATSVDFPQMASLGFALQVTEHTLVETDINWTGWSSFDVLAIDFVNNDLPDVSRPQQFDDVFNYRLGVRRDLASGNQLRFGLVYDKTPQPEEAVSPLLPDSDRLGLTVGYGYNGTKYSFDLAVMYLDFDDRTRAESFPGEGDFFGTYETQGLLIGATLGF